MNSQRLVLLGLSLALVQAALLLLGWIVFFFTRPKSALGIERTLLRWLSVSVYVGLSILLTTAIGEIVQNTIRGSR